MKKFTKALSVVLAVMMIMCTVSALSFSASAAETNKINLTSNVGDSVSYDYSADSTQVTVTYKLQSNVLIENIQAVVSYDSSVLKLADTNKKKTISPVFYGSSGGGFEANLGLKNMIKFNATNPDGYDFTKGGVVFTAVFDIIGKGNTTVDFDMYILTGTENYKDIKMVYRDEVVNKNFTLTASGNVTTPVQTEAAVIGDISTKLTKTSANVYSGTVELGAGSYKFKISVGDTQYGSSVTVNDSGSGITLKSTWSSQATLVATGGKYTFTFDQSTGKLAVQYQKLSEDVEVIGDIALKLNATSDNVYSGTTELESGSYKFKMSVAGTEYGTGATINDTAKGITYKSTWSSKTTLNATGGKYTFIFDTSTSKLTITCEKDSNKVAVIGDIALELKETSKDVYSGTISLDEGVYKYKISVGGKEYGGSTTVTDSGSGISLRDTWSSKATLIASGGQYTFTFNKATSKLSIKYYAGDIVALIGDLKFELKPTATENMYSALVDIKAGTYKYKVSVNGVEYGTAMVINDTAGNITYKSTWSSKSTLNATGGTYLIRYDTAANKLSITKKS